MYDFEGNLASAFITVDDIIASGLEYPISGDISTIYREDDFA
jgi:hypothetical protein